jgi:sugar transferase (PEP-CTERM/EpsH1 system associated)
MQAGGSAVPIRIMHVVDTLGKGGLENGLVNLIQQLDSQRFEHVVCAIRGLGLNVERLPDRVRVICLDKKPGSRFQALALSRAIRSAGPDIVHSRNWAAIEAVVAASWLRSPAIVHSEHGMESDGNAAEPWRRICFRRLAYGLADRVVSVSSQLKNLHARRTGFSSDKIAVIHNGVDCQRFRPDPVVRARIRDEWKLADDDFCIGCVGNLLPVKDHMTLLRALAGLSEQTNRWHLFVAGEGPGRPELEAFVNAHEEWKHRVSFLGLSNRVPELLNAMDLYVLPSLFEGIANSLLEAMATGVPAVVTSVGGNPEVVVDGESGLLFPARDDRKLASLLGLVAGRADLRLTLANQAMRRVREKFSIDSMVRKYDELYESMTPSSPAAKLRAAGGA